jgi:hypothetical protein
MRLDDAICTSLPNPKKTDVGIKGEGSDPEGAFTFTGTRPPRRRPAVHER